MGSSFFAIGLVTQLDGQVLGPLLALMFFLPILLTGFSVAHIAEGWSGVRRAAPLILLASVVMNALMWGRNVLGSAPVSSMLPGLAGAIILWLAGRTSLYYVPASPADALPSSLFLPLRFSTICIAHCVFDRGIDTGNKRKHSISSLCIGFPGAGHRARLPG